jgi:PTS system, lactose/cellobiose family IIC component
MENKFITRLATLAGKMATQRHIMAIRDAFVMTVPITIAAAIFVLINNVVLNDQIMPIIANMPFADKLSELCVQVYNGTIGVLGLLVTFLIGYSLAKSYELEGAIEGMMSVACYVILVPNIVEATTPAWDDVLVQGALPQTYTNASIMFLGIIAAIVSVTLIHRLSKFEKLGIKMPDSVPPAIAKSFNSVFPILIILTIFGLVEVTLRNLTGMDVPAIIARVLQMPLVGGFQTLPGIILYVFLATFVFVFGIHGAFVFGAISGPILSIAQQQNLDAIRLGLAAPNIVSGAFLDVYVYMGGGGTMLCLIIALFIASKREDERAIAKLGAASGLFNISEPIMFGLPVVFNIVYAIPFCIVPVVSTIIGYVATLIGFASPTYVHIPWVTPPLISGYLASGGDIKVSIVQAVVLIVGTLIYMPFVIVSNNMKKNDVVQN